MPIPIACVPRWLRGTVIDDTTRWNKFIAVATNILQLHDLNPDMPGLSLGPTGREDSFVGLLRQWNQLRHKWLNRADTTLKEVVNLGKDQTGKLFRAFYAEQVQTHPNGTAFEGELTTEQLTGPIYGLEEEALGVRAKMQMEFREFLNAVEESLVNKVRRTITDPAQILVRDAEVAAIRKDFDRLREKPYFPLMRFGKYSLTVLDSAGRVEEFQQFESKREQEAELALQKKHPRASEKTLRIGIIPDSIQGMAGMPPRLMQMMISEMNLTPEQRNVLRDITLKLAPGNSFRKQLIRRKGTAGFSEDGLRTYANYFFHGANHLGRMTYKEPLEAVIDLADRRIPRDGNVIDVRKVQGVKQYMREHLTYIMNPQNEWSGLRAFGFIWYLGFMPKSAFINLTQVPLVSYPFLATRYGDVKAVAELAKAMKDGLRSITADRGLAPDELAAMTRLLDDGLINQSFATELAGVANGTMLSKLTVSNQLGGRLAQSVVGQGAYMFSLAEGYNRRVTGIASYRLARNGLLQGRTFDSLTEEERNSISDQAYLEARSSIERTQFEYSSWNRPVFMRGKKSAIFLFMQYVQNMLFFIARDPGRLRFLGLMVFAAGIQGMPFMEDLLDLLDVMFSTKNKKFDSRKEARELITDLGLNADMLMLGSGAYSFGLPWLGAQVGLPLPEVDVRGSLSLGRIIPGFEPATEMLGGAAGLPLSDPDRSLMDFQENAGGALMAIPMNIIRASLSDSPHTWKRFETAMPSSIRSIMRGIRFAREGEEVTGSGATLHQFDTENPKEVAEILMQVAGFAPRAVTKAQTIRAQSKEVEIFYRVRRGELLGVLDFGFRVGDRDAIKAGLDGITQYNRDVPYGELRISREDIRQSRRARTRSRVLAERGVPNSPRYFRVTQETAKAFGDTRLDENTSDF
jgi:hypothetical protein